MALTFEVFKELYNRIQRGNFESDRKLASEYGVNRNCIYLIRQGRHRYFNRLDNLNSDDKVLIYPVLDDENRLNYTRCKQCGNKVQEGIPCFICHVREYRNKKIKKALETLQNE